MFYYLEGKVEILEQGIAVIDCNGIGYACRASQNTIGKLRTGEVARLLTYLNVREDVFELYGFINEEERSCFKMLIGVSGVGPKAALSILSIASPDKLALSIITGDAKVLTQAPGVGKKIAQRIVLELKDKMSKEQLEALPEAASMIGATGGKVNHTQEAVAALMVLGYSQSEALYAMEGLDTGNMETEQIIQQSLRKLGMRN